MPITSIITVKAQSFLFIVLGLPSMLAKASQIIPVRAPNGKAAIG